MIFSMIWGTTCTLGSSPGNMHQVLMLWSFMLGGSRFLQQPQAAPSGTKPFLLLPAELEKAPNVWCAVGTDPSSRLLAGILYHHFSWDIQVEWRGLPVSLRSSGNGLSAKTPQKAVLGTVVLAIWILSQQRAVWIHQSLHELAIS